MHLLDQQLNLMVRGRIDEAWKICEKIQAETPDDLRHIFNRGWFLINQGKYQEGYKALEAGRFLQVYGGNRLNTKKPIWNQEDLNGKTVIINFEGGYGDNIIFARFSNEIEKRGGITIYCCDRSLHSLFSRISHVAKCITISEIDNTPHDYWIPSFSCSWIFGTTFDTLPNDPYLTPNLNSVEIWKSIINSDKLKVGIRWSGNPKYEHQQFRIFPPELMTNLKKHSVQLYSLQKDTDVMELPDEIIDLQHLLISWEDTAAAIENMDLVISSCTAVAHLSAAMGKPTWVVVPILPYHIWAYGDKHSPWYPETTRIFRQKDFGSWNETFDEINANLHNLTCE